MNLKDKKIILAVGGSDPSSGAGVQADIRTADRLGCYAVSVITAVTAQNSIEFSGLWSLDVEKIESQLRSIGEDFRIDGVKIGMLGSVDAIKAVASFLKNLNCANVVVDPLISPTLRQEKADVPYIEALASMLFPLATIVTPNIPEGKEIEEITGQSITGLCNAVLLKGGHGDEEECKDILFYREEVFGSTQMPSTAFPTINFNHSSLFNHDNILPQPAEYGEEITERIFRHRKIPTSNTHGTGCVLSTSIACYLAEGYGLEKAVSSAIKFTQEALKTSSRYRLTKGDYGPAMV